VSSSVEVAAGRDHRRDAAGGRRRSRARPCSRSRTSTASTCRSQPRSCRSSTRAPRQRRHRGLLKREINLGAERRRGPSLRRRRSATSSRRRPAVGPGCSRRPGGWTLDWWIGAEDLWHVPLKAERTRPPWAGERRFGLETAIRCRAARPCTVSYAVRAPDELVVVEVENRSRAPFAVAFCGRLAMSSSGRNDLHRRWRTCARPRAVRHRLRYEGRLRCSCSRLLTATLRAGVLLDGLSRRQPRRCPGRAGGKRLGVTRG
jgi:hypothetical protein